MTTTISDVETLERIDTITISNVEFEQNQGIDTFEWLDEPTISLLAHYLAKSVLDARQTEQTINPRQINRQAIKLAAAELREQHDFDMIMENACLTHSQETVEVLVGTTLARFYHDLASVYDMSRTELVRKIVLSGAKALNPGQAELNDVTRDCVLTSGVTTIFKAQARGTHVADLDHLFVDTKNVPDWDGEPVRYL